MDGRSYRLNVRRTMEAVLAASLLSVLSVVVVGRPHPQRVAERAAQYPDLVATRVNHVRMLRTNAPDPIR